MFLSSCGAMEGLFAGGAIGSAIGGVTGGWRGSNAGALIGMATGAAIGASVDVAEARKREQARYNDDVYLCHQDNRYKTHRDAYARHYYQHNGKKQMPTTYSNVSFHSNSADGENRSVTNGNGFKLEPVIPESIDASKMVDETNSGNDIITME